MGELGFTAGADGDEPTEGLHILDALPQLFHQIGIGLQPLPLAFNASEHGSGTAFQHMLNRKREDRRKKAAIEFP